MIFKATEENIFKASELIKQGECVAFPTETVYGLGANAFNSLACVKIFEIKQRPFFDPLIVHVAEFENNEMARKLAENFWPGPMTLILKKNQNIPDIVTAGLETVAVRMPDHPVALALLEELNEPLLTTTLQLPGDEFSLTEGWEIQDRLDDQLELILDCGPCGTEPTTVIDLTGASPELIRAGRGPLELFGLG